MQLSEVINARPKCAKTLGNSSAFAKQRVNFRTSALYNGSPRIFGKWKSANLYVVYSYGEHWPLYVWDDEAQQWFGNETRFSVSTTNHKNKACPDWSRVDWLTSAEIKNLVNDGGILGRIRARVMEGNHAVA